MKLDDAACFSSSNSLKRKCDLDLTDRRAKRPLVQQKRVYDVDVLQARAQQGRNSQSTRRGTHAVSYPVNCDPIDGLSPTMYAMQVNRTSCPRCLQGESGHFRHILEK